MPPRPSGPALAASSPLPRMAVPEPRPEPVQGPRLKRLEDVVALAEDKRDIALKAALERDVHLVRFEEGRIEFRLAEGGRPSLAGDLAKALGEWTGRRWMVALSREDGAPTLAARTREATEERHQNAASHPLVREVLARFPGAQIVDVREKAPDPVPAPAPDEASAPEPGEDEPDDV